MKKIFIYLLLSTFIIGFASSCKDEEPSSKSIFDNESSVQNDFDKWLFREYISPYNIELKYRMEDIESDYSYNLIPARYDKSVQLAHLIKHLWLEPYDQLVGANFTRQYIPKVVHFIGSYGYNPNGTVVLGTAEGGLRITLYAVNELVIDPDVLIDRYFHTMHHEFAHIFHQTKNYDESFQLISEGKYVGGEWNSSPYQGQGLQNGFITDYGRYSADEDFVELYSTYITVTSETWKAMMTVAGTNGAAIIARKLEIVKKYMQDSWGIDMDEMRKIILNRSDEIDQLDLNSLD